jgi:hypothetical protein
MDTESRALPGASRILEGLRGRRGLVEPREGIGWTAYARRSYGLNGPFQLTRHNPIYF